MSINRSKSGCAKSAGAGTLKAGVVAAVLGIACQQLAPAAARALAGSASANADRFALITFTDHNGNATTLAEFRGKAVVVIFGYADCPDLCSTTLTEMGQAMRLLGTDASRVQVVFVTLDPRRDARTLLAQIVPAFDPDFLGLFGDAAQTAQAAHEFEVFYKERPGSTPDSYSVDHTAGSFVLDPRGQLRLFLHYGM